MSPKLDQRVFFISWDMCNPHLPRLPCSRKRNCDESMMHDAFSKLLKQAPFFSPGTLGICNLIQPQSIRDPLQLSILRIPRGPGGGNLYWCNTKIPRTLQSFPQGPGYSRHKEILQILINHLTKKSPKVALLRLIALCFKIWNYFKDLRHSDAF